MIQIHPFALSEKEVRILTYIFIYRGMRAKDLAVFETRTNRYSLSDEKSIYNYLAKLKRKGLIKSTRLQGVNSVGSIYYLSTNGLELIKSLLNISVGQQGNGILPISEETTFWDVPAEYQLPPLKQTEHFLLGIELFKRLIAGSDTAFKHTTTFYSNLVYIHDQKQHKVKPDAAVIINNNFFAVEIDRATESHDQLIQKFRKYKEHYDYCQRVEDKMAVKKVHTILFVVEERSRRHGIQRRWTNVLSAFFEAFGQDFPNINLILVPMDNVSIVLHFESKREYLEKEALKMLENQYEEKGYSTKFKMNNQLFITNGNNFILPTIQLHHEYESRLYKDLYELEICSMDCEKLGTINLKINEEKTVDLKFGATQGAWESFTNTPTFPVGIDKTNMNPATLKKMILTKKYFEKYNQK